MLEKNLHSGRSFDLLHRVLAVSTLALLTVTSPRIAQAFDPASKVVQAVGFYAHGSLKNASSIPDEGFGFLKVFRPRNRGFGTKTLIDVVLAAAERVRRIYPSGDRLQLADSASHHGGQLSGHDSHQNGLDMDIIYLRMNKRELAPQDPGWSGFDEKFVRHGVLTPNFDLQRNWEVMRSLVATKKVARIFVDAAIKKALCEGRQQLVGTGSQDEATEVLRRLRPYPFHDDHLHVRVNCPAGTRGCVPQAEPAMGSGCARQTGLSFRKPSRAGRSSRSA